MTGLVLSHLVNGVVDGVEVGLLGVDGDAHLVGVGAGLCHHALLKVGLGVPYHVAEELGKLGSMLSLFPSVALEGLSDFGIALAVGLARHGQVHAHFGTFAEEVVVEVFDHLLAGAFGNADLMLGDELELFAVVNFFEFAAGSAAQRALFGCLVTFVNIATYGADLLDELN